MEGVQEDAKLEEFKTQFPVNLLNYFAFNCIFIEDEDFILFVSAAVKNCCSRFINRGHPLIAKNKQLHIYKLQESSNRFEGWASLIKDPFIIHHLHQYPYRSRYHVVGEIQQSKKILACNNECNVNGETLVNFSKTVSSPKENIVFVMWDGHVQRQMLNNIPDKFKPIILNINAIVINQNNSNKTIVINLVQLQIEKEKLLHTVQINVEGTAYKDSSLNKIHDLVCKKMHGGGNFLEYINEITLCVFEKLFMKYFVK